MSNIEVLQRRSFSTIHHVGLPIQEIINLCNKVGKSRCSIQLDNKELSLAELIDPRIKVITFYHSGERNTHIYHSIKEAIEFFDTEPLGTIASGIIKYNDIEITKQQLYGL